MVCIVRVGSVRRLEQGSADAVNGVSGFSTMVKLQLMVPPLPSPTRNPSTGCFPACAQIDGLAAAFAWGPTTPAL